MTNEDIIILARKVRDWGHWDQLDLVRFARMVIHDERSSCIADVRRSRLSLDGEHGVSHETSYIADRVLDNAIRKIEERAAK